jgi:hypothetical protein
MELNRKEPGRVAGLFYAGRSVGSDSLLQVYFTPMITASVSNADAFRSAQPSG